MRSTDFQVDENAVMVELSEMCLHLDGGDGMGVLTLNRFGGHTFTVEVS